MKTNPRPKLNEKSGKPPGYVPWDNTERRILRLEKAIEELNLELKRIKFEADGNE